MTERDVPSEAEREYQVVDVLVERLIDVVVKELLADQHEHLLVVLPVL